MTEPTASDRVAEYAETLRCEVETALDAAATFSDDCPERLRDALRYVLLAPGKRLRPLLVLSACELCGGDRSRAMPAACAVEMIHAYSLIHDDLPSMDDDDLRRGLPTCHKKFDEATAVLAGDAMQALAFEMIGNLSPWELAGRGCKELAVAAGPCRLVGGQMDDVSREKGLGDRSRDSETPRDLMQRIHLRKTGALMRVSLRLGGLVAGAPEATLAALDAFGIDFGLAFQITDDLLDALGDERTVGKRLRKDAGKDKWSYTTLLGVEEARREAERVVGRAVRTLDEIGKGRGESLPYQMLRDLTEGLLTRRK